MHRPDALLLHALRSAPRRYRMPPLPADAAAARALGRDAALTFAIEAARLAHVAHARPSPELAGLFTTALAGLIRGALQPENGDPAFQALVLRRQAPAADEYLRLAATRAADERSVRSAVDAVAHPGKLRGMESGPSRDALARLRELAAAAAWRELREGIDGFLADPPAGQAFGGAAFERLRTQGALARLERGRSLSVLEPVQHLLALLARQGPPAGSSDAGAHGRAAARAGDLAEEATLRAFHQVAGLLDGREGASRHRAVRGLRTPGGFPGAREKTKDEWDAAILRSAGGAGAADVVLLAEVKASPAAATSDVIRLLRGLQRLAQAGGADHDFPSADGMVRLAGASLQALAPQRHALPERVIYCCTAGDDAAAPLLAAASKAVLLAEPASLAYAHALAAGETPREAMLLPVWEALPGTPRLRAVLHQYDTARAARQAMLHPEDLLDAVRAAAAGA